MVGPAAPVKRGVACDCPRLPAQFERDFQCSGADPAGQIDLDMARHPDGVSRADIDRGLLTLQRNQSSMIHFSIVDNRVYSLNHGLYGGFQKFFNEILWSLKRKVYVAVYKRAWLGLDGLGLGLMWAWA